MAFEGTISVGGAIQVLSAIIVVVLRSRPEVLAAFRISITGKIDGENEV